VAAGTLGALMATLDISIVNSSLPTIQGEIGASGTEGTWIATAYLVAEIVIIPMSAWLERCWACACCCSRRPVSSPCSRCCAACRPRCR
jgi:MFS family permease